GAAAKAGRASAPASCAPTGITAPRMAPTASARRSRRARAGGRARTSGPIVAGRVAAAPGTGAPAAMQESRAVPRSTWPPCAGAIHIAPSVLGSDHGALTASVRALEGSGAERIHVDVMDGMFVPNFALGTDATKAIRQATDLPLELHLMIREPDHHLETFRDA